MTLKDIFYNVGPESSSQDIGSSDTGLVDGAQLPIRRTSSPSPTATQQACKRVLETVSMLFSHVSLSLYDLEKERGKEGGKVWGVSKVS